MKNSLEDDSLKNDRLKRYIINPSLFMIQAPIERSQPEF